MQLREIKATDNKALANIIRTVFDEHNAPREGTVYCDPDLDNLYELFKKEKAVFWVAEENGEILGCCGIYPTEGLPENCAELVKFYLAAQARGKGIGKLLMDKSVASAIRFGYTKLYIESLPHYANAVRMYEKAGFKKLKKPLGNSGHTTCNIWMLKEI